jgi:hypothetical protein
VTLSSSAVLGRTLFIAACLVSSLSGNILTRLGRKLVIATVPLCVLPVMMPEDSTLSDNGHILLRYSFFPTQATSPASNVSCPEEYNAANHYKASDKVSMLLDGNHAVMYQCSSDIHTAKFCSQYKPGHWSNLGWIFLGNCNGTIVPTDPFAGLEEFLPACPSVYDPHAKYEGKDLVSVDALNTAEKRFVYQCKVR